MSFSSAGGPAGKARSRFSTNAEAILSSIIILIMLRFNGFHGCPQPPLEERISMAMEDDSMIQDREISLYPTTSTPIRAKDK